MSTHTQQVKVLVAGFDSESNPLTRALRQYSGCRVLYTNADESRFSTDVDIAIIQRNFINKSKFELLKDTFKERQTPMLMATQGFSDIKQQFENLLYERAKKMPTAPITPPKQIHRSTSTPFNPAMQGLMQAAIKPPEVKKEQPPVDSFKSQIEVQYAAEEEMKARSHHSKEMLDKIYTVVYECQQAEMGGLETCEMLNSEGMTRANGVAYSPQDIYSMRQSISKQGWKPAKVPAKKPGQLELKPTPPAPPVVAAVRKVETPVVAPVAPAAQVAATLADNPLEMIGEVLADTKIPQDRKLDIIQKIQSGEIKTRLVNNISVENYLLVLVRGTFIDPIRTRIRLSKDEAALVLANLGLVETFAATGQL